MSYILDALRRADAERERGAVPSLHTQQYGALPGDEDDGTPPRSRLSTVVMVLLAAALIAVVGWHYFASDTTAKTIVQSPIVPVPLPVAAPAVLPGASMPVVPPAADDSAATEPAAVAGAARSHTAADEHGAASATQPRAVSRTATRRDAPAAAATATTLASPAASAAGDRIYALADLPDDIRRDLPKLAFGGASYSSDAASRMVILNGQVFHEGDTVSRGLVLQRVNRKSAVLAIRGYRYELGF